MVPTEYETKAEKDRTQLRRVVIEDRQRKMALPLLRFGPLGNS